jgi:hypothetical protein
MVTVFLCIASYLNKDGKIENNVKFYDGVLKGGKTREEVWREIYNLSVDQEHNYDAMYGYVKNYNWTARMDGGYECTTTIISIGEIMESLKRYDGIIFIKICYNCKEIVIHKKCY